jgi:hypothetical protein
MMSLVLALNTIKRAKGRASIAALTCKATAAIAPRAKQRLSSKAINSVERGGFMLIRLNQNMNYTRVNIFTRILIRIQEKTASALSIC